MSEGPLLRPPPPNTLEEEEARLLRELAREDSAPREGPLTLPSRVKLAIASPCPERWESMPGDDRVRRCTRCGRDAIDLCGLASNEIEPLLSARGLTLPARMYRRADGAVTFSDCDVGRPRRIAMQVLGVVAALVVGATLASWALHRNDPAAPSASTNAP